MLSTEEYSHLMRNWSVLKSQIEDARKLGLRHKELAQRYKDTFDKLQLELRLYTTSFKGVIKEYKDTHPPEESE